MTARSKTTNPGWPDPTHWVNRLYQELSERKAIYDELPDGRKRSKAAAMLAAVVHYLRELPPFKDSNAVLPLKDLLIFLDDLDRGRDHPWATPTNVGGTNITSSAQRELKIWVRGAFSVMRENGFEPTAAYRHIADGLTKNGRRGRANTPVRWRLVQRWCLEPETPGEKRQRERLEGWWPTYRTHILASGKPASDEEIAGMFADHLWSLEHLRDRSVSVVSK